MSQSNLISFLQTWGIILVVIGHSFLQPIKYIQEWIYVFHMPLFMFISGYLLQYSCKKKNETLSQTLHNNHFILKKVKRLLIPYITISSLAFVPKVLLSRFAQRTIEFSISDYIHMLVFPWDNVIVFFWFLPTLFLIFSILYISRGGVSRLPYWIILSITLLLHIFNPLPDIKILNISGVLNYVFYFFTGYYACQFSIFQYFENRSYIIFCITLILSFIFLFIPTFTGLDVLKALNGIILSIAMGVIYNQKHLSFFNHLYGASFAIYLFSWFPQVFSLQILMSITHIPWYVCTILAAISGIYIPLFIYKKILKYRDTKLGKLILFLTGL